MNVPHPDHPNLVVVDHPVVRDRLTRLRDRNCGMEDFRSNLHECARVMAAEITRNLPCVPVRIETPLTEMEATEIDRDAAVIVPILRAGLGMSAALSEILPGAPVGHIGVYRDHATLRPVEYLVRLPDLHGKHVFLVDPMLATGHSCAHATTLLLAHGAAAEKIRLMALVAAPEGVREMARQHPAVRIWSAALDSHLNDHGYIVPGLGDAGDRLFGTA